MGNDGEISDGLLNRPLVGMKCRFYMDGKNEVDEIEFLGKKLPKADSGIVLELFCVIRYVLIIIELKISAKVHAQSLTNISPPKKNEY